MNKTIIFAGGGVLAGVGVAAALFFFVLGGSGTNSAAPDGVATPEPTPVVVPGRIGPHITLEDRLYTLSSSDGEQRYVKLSVVIEFETFDEEWDHVLHGCVFAAEGDGEVGPCQAEENDLLHEFEEELGTGRQLIEDAVVSIVSSKTYAELNTADGREALRTEILHAVEDLIEEPRVVRVLFLEFLTQ
jgi:flagellar basal body-associated protein FliL